MASHLPSIIFFRKSQPNILISFCSAAVEAGYHFLGPVARNHGFLSESILDDGFSGSQLKVSSAEDTPNCLMNGSDKVKILDLLFVVFG